MDYSYYQNENGKFTAKKLPTTKTNSVKIKDDTDITGLKYALQDENPKNVSQFKALHEEEFSSHYDYEPEVDSFKDMVMANKNKVLGEDLWIKLYWHELSIFINDIEDLELDEEPHSVNDDFAKHLLGVKVVEEMQELDYKDWESYLSPMKLPDIKVIAKQAGLKVSKNKAELIHELILLEEQSNGTLQKPKLIKALPLMLEKIENIQQVYINEIEKGLSEFEYPEKYKAAVWVFVTDFHEGDIKELAEEKLNEYSQVIEDDDQELSANDESDLAIKISISGEKVHTKESPKESWIEAVTKHTLKPSIKINFQYINSKKEASNRELRLDAIMFDNGLTYFYGFCYKANAIRTFRIDRIENDIAIIETGELISVQQLVNKQIEGLKKHNNLVSHSLTQSTIKKAAPATVKKGSLLNSTKQKPINNQITEKPSKSSIIVGWFLGLAAIGGAGSNFENKEFFAGMMCFFAIFVVIPPILNKLNAKNKKMAEEKGAISSNLTQKSANIFGLILILIAAFIGS
ncbi:WYL domain-containing protein [Pseudoalteromonas nigrifaciens]|uniref:WYL domain-containing protein n=1 Tax=Pseudoalteromonas nigrifaciens TaxID=28109 RepID=UPI003F9DC99D